jgi:hypothetical protein
VTTKQEVLDEISTLLSVQKFYVTTGSSEPKDFFVSVIEQLGIDIGQHPNTKPGLARAIVEAFGQIWLPEYESTGSTVTLQGLMAILEIVRKIKN